MRTHYPLYMTSKQTGIRYQFGYVQGFSILEKHYEVRVEMVNKASSNLLLRELFESVTDRVNKSIAIEHFNARIQAHAVRNTPELRYLTKIIGMKGFNLSFEKSLESLLEGCNSIDNEYTSIVLKFKRKDLVTKAKKKCLQ